MGTNEYKVAGYNERIPGYDGEYLPNIDPEFVFPYAGDPEKQEKYQNDILELAAAAEPATKDGSDEDKEAETANTGLVSTDPDKKDLKVS